MSQKPNNILKISNSRFSGKKVLRCFRKFFDKFKIKFKKNKIIEADDFDKVISDVREIAINMTKDEKEIFSNFLLFGDKIVAKVMIPRSDICGVPSDASKKDIIDTLSANMHTRILVYEDTLDNITGFLHIKDLLCIFAKNHTFNLKKIIRKPIIAAPSMKLVDLLAEMQKKKTHIAVILDEYGGTGGIVTIEDIIEELVGQIEDEHDAEDKSPNNIRIINPKTILCNARVPVEEVEKILKMKLKRQDDYFETVGGLILARAGYFPKEGTTIAMEENLFAEIIEAGPKSIKTLKLMVK